jgi:hypothetical protein
LSITVFKRKYTIIPPDKCVKIPEERLFVQNKNENAENIETKFIPFCEKILPLGKN